MTYYSRKRNFRQAIAPLLTQNEQGLSLMTANYVSPYTTGAREASPTQMETLIIANAFKPWTHGCNLKWTSFCSLKCNLPSTQMTHPRDFTRLTTTQNTNEHLAKGLVPLFAETSSNLVQSYTFLALPTNLGFGLSTYHTHQ